jgi:transposase, IS5 family
VELGEQVVPDESTILCFRHLLDQHGLTQAIFEEVHNLLEERRLLLRSGTAVDTTIIAAPSSTKNAAPTRDPEMKQTRKGQHWYSGTKLHIGAGRRPFGPHHESDRRQFQRHHSAARAAAQEGARAVRR